MTTHRKAAMSRPTRHAVSAAVVVFVAIATPASAQSLFQRSSEIVREQPQPGAVYAGGQPPMHDPAADLAGVSLFAIQPTPPRQILPNDLITIIVNQSSRIEHDQTLETEKKVDQTAQIDALPDFWKLLELRLEAGRTTNLPRLDLGADQQFDANGKYDREDRITARLTAKVLDVKPNGTIVLEARNTLITDEEEQVFLLSGSCRAEDVTQSNTVQSTSLSDLRLEIYHNGEVRKAAHKGVLTKLIESIFAF